MVLRAFIRARFNSNKRQIWFEGNDMRYLMGQPARVRSLQREPKLVDE